MPKNLPTRCKVCGLTREGGAHISRRGLCDEHAYDRMVAQFKSASIGGPEVSERVRRSWDARRRNAAAQGVGGAAAKVAAPKPAKRTSR